MTSPSPSPNPNSNQEPRSSASEEVPPGKRRAAPRTRSFVFELLFYLLLFAVPMLMLYFPEILWAIKHSGEPEQTVSIGIVQKVSFVSGLQKTSQLETDSTRVLVKGLVKTKVGTALVQRNARFGLEVCEATAAASTPCWSVIED